MLFSQVAALEIFHSEIIIFISTHSENILDLLFQLSRKAAGSNTTVEEEEKLENFTQLPLLLMMGFPTPSNTVDMERKTTGQSSNLNDQ